MNDLSSKPFECLPLFSDCFRHIQWAAFLVCLGVLGCIEPGEPAHGDPEIIDLQTHRATIAWHSDQPGPGRIFVQPADGTSKRRSVEDRLPGAIRHELVVTGLTPGSRYSYWIEGASRKYQLQTKPSPQTPFSFFISAGRSVDEDILALALNELAEFVLVLSEEAEVEKRVGGYLPVYGLDGLHSTYLDEVYSDRKSPFEAMEWGGLVLVFAEEDALVQRLPLAPSAHTIGAVLKRDRDSGKRGELPSPQSIEGSALHKGLLLYNETHGDSPVSFVLMPGNGAFLFKIGQISYLGVDVHGGAVDSQDSGIIRVDVGRESVRAAYLGQDRELSLRATPLVQRRTCEECRRLADRGLYQESVEAYRKFIEGNAGHYQVDDAYYEIAQLLDTKLFRLQEALAAYENLMEKFPDSALAVLARQRIDYLRAHADNQFVPLSRFERIKSGEFSADMPRKDRVGLVEKARGIADAFPHSSLAPVIHHWIGNQYRFLDVDAAVAEYRLTILRYPAYSGLQDVWMQMGETLYEDRRYADALGVYAQAGERFPGSIEEIQSQKDRCHRNLRRHRLGWLSGATILGFLFLAMILSPVGISLRMVPLSLLAFMLLSAVFLFMGWLIWEQFASPLEVVLLSVSISASACLGVPFGSSFAEKIARGDNGRRWFVIRAALGATVTLPLLVSGVFLCVWLINEHYLVVLGL